MLECDNHIWSLILDGTVQIEPLDERCVRPASICLRLGPVYLTPVTRGPVYVTDEATYPHFEAVEGTSRSPICVPSKSFILGHTIERLSLPRTHAAWISNLSGLARLGIGVALSSFVSPGFGEECKSALTLEISNSLDVPVYLRPGMRVCHLLLLRLSGESTESYDSQVGTYSKQDRPEISRFFMDFSLGDDSS
jgi:dCTP deaminase